MEATATTAVEEPQPTAAQAQAVQIEYWSPWTDPTSAEVVANVTTEFEKAYEDIKVNRTEGGPGGGDFNELLLARIAAGNPPDAATIWTPPVGFAARGSLDAVDDLMDVAQYGKHDQFFEKPLYTCQFRGKTYGFPMSAASAGVWYNKEWFGEVGLPTEPEDFPKTWDEFRDVSDKFTVWEGEALKTAGFVPWASTWTYPIWSGLNGSQWYSAADEKYTIDSAANLELAEYWLSWLDEQYGGDVEYLSSFATWGVGGEDSAFNTKVNPGALAGAWVVNRPTAAFDKIGFEYDVARNPIGPSGTKSVTGYWPNWFVQPLGGKQRDKAFLFNEFFCTVGANTWHQLWFDTPAWRGVSRDTLTTLVVDMFGADKAREWNDFFIDYLEDAVEAWTSPIEDFGTDQINRAIDQILHKAKSPKEALDEAQRVTQTRLEETLASL